MQFYSDYFYLVTLVIPGVAGGNTQTEFAFEDQPDIRFARTSVIEIFFAEDLTHAQPQPTPVIPGNLANKISFNFQTNDPDLPVPQNEVPGRGSGTLDTIQWIPGTRLHLIQNNNALAAGWVRGPIFWNDRYVIWQKSKMKVSPGGFGNTTDIAVVLGVHYTWLTKKGDLISPRN